jgi:hypothetical protein
LSFTIVPGGSGMGDKLVTETIIPPYMLNRYGDIYAEVNLHFGFWEKTVKITSIFIRAIIYVSQNTSIEININAKEKTVPLGNFIAYGDANLKIPTIINVSKNVDLLLFPGDEYTIDITATKTNYIGIVTDSYIWMDILEARSAPVDTWWQVLTGNPLAIALIIALLSFFAREYIYETEEQIQRKTQLNEIQIISKNIKSSNYYLKEIKKLFKINTNSNSKDNEHKS